MNLVETAPVGRGARVRLEPDGDSFHCAEGQTLLAAALAAGVDLPYECASGSCGSCRARLMAGSVRSLWSAATGLTDRDRRQGDRILCCQSLAGQDCVIRIRRGDQRVPVAPARLRAQVRGVRALNDEVLHLSACADHAVRFLPGQFMLIDWGGDIGRRAYSMANLATGTGRLEFLIKRKPGGSASRQLVERLNSGEPLQLEGPYGRAWLREDSDREIVLLAGGSGLAPVWAIALRAAERWPQKRLRLFFGVNRASDLFWQEEIDAARQACPGLEVTTVLMQAADGDPPGCRYGTLVDVMNESLDRLAQSDLYMAGPPGLIDSVMREFVATGRVAADRVFFDRFS